MKTRLPAQIGATAPLVKSGAVRTSEPVGPAAAIGDGANTPQGESFRPDNPPPHLARETTPYGNPAASYDGEDRRQKDRRRSTMPTTLDTRKFGIDRRANSRISLKV